MSEFTLYDAGAPSIEVRVYRDGDVIARELCESEDEANLIVDRYGDEPGVSFEVEDLTSDRWPGEILGSPSVGFEDELEAVEPMIPEQGGER